MRSVPRGEDCGRLRTFYVREHTWWCKSRCRDTLRCSCRWFPHRPALHKRSVSDHHVPTAAEWVEVDTPQSVETSLLLASRSPFRGCQACLQMFPRPHRGRRYVTTPILKTPGRPLSALSRSGEAEQSSRTSMRNMHVEGVRSSRHRAMCTTSRGKSTAERRRTSHIPGD